MEYIFILQLVIITIISMMFTSNMIMQSISNNEVVTKSEIFIYFAIIFINITTGYIVSYFTKDSSNIKLFLTITGGVGVLISSYAYLDILKYRKANLDIKVETAYFLNVLLIFAFIISSGVLCYTLGYIYIAILPLILGIIIFNKENRKLRSKGAVDIYNKANSYHMSGDYNKAFKYFMKAADLEYAPAMDSVGLYYEEGTSVEKNIAEAIKYYKMAAELNYAPSLYNLGYCYENGKGVETNYEEAFNNYKKASELGDSLATYSLGICYELGRGTSINYGEAYKCYSEGIEKGDAKSYYSLGNLYEKGLYVKEDLEEALKLYEIARSYGYSLAEDKIEYIKELKLKKYLDNIIGLESVKKEVIGLQAFARLQKKRLEQNINSNETLTLHMIFSGNPGTGKTTIARAVAEMFQSIGVLKTNNVVEADRETLVGQYIGQTAIKTKEVVESALDGVLFIDEAYTLSRGEENDFGREAIDTLVKLMEDYRDRIVIVLAGYTDEMDKFLKTNSGLKSRFPNIIEFPDYSTDELLSIVDLQVKKNGYILSVDAKLKIKQLLEENRVEPNFGNGRGIRNLFEKAVKNMAVRLANTDQGILTKENYETILPDDIEWVD